MKNDRNKRYELLDSVLGWKWLDVQRVTEILEESGIDNLDFSEYIEQYCIETSLPIQNIDACGVAYEYILELARSNIEEYTGKDIVNDTDGFSVYQNYICTSFDCADDVRELIISLVDQIPEEKRAKATQFVVDNI